MEQDTTRVEPCRPVAKGCTSKVVGTPKALHTICTLSKPKEATEDWIGEAADWIGAIVRSSETVTQGPWR